MLLRPPRQEEGEGPVLRRLFGLLRPQKGLVGGGLALLLLSVPCELVPGAVALYLVDDLIIPATTGEGDIGQAHAWLHAVVSFGGRLSGWPALLASVLAWMGLFAVLGTALKAASTNLMERAAHKLVYRLRNDLYNKLQGQSLGYLHRQRTGDLMSRCVGDVEQVQQFIINGVDQVLAEGLIWAIVVVTVFLIDWRVASFTLAPILLVYVLLRVFNAKARPIYRAARESAGRVSARLQENLGGLTTIKIFSREGYERERFADETRLNYDDNIRATNARTTYFPVTGVLAGVAGVAMYGSGAYFVLTGSFTLGGMLAFRAYYWRLFGPIFTLARVNDLVQRSAAAARRAFEVLDAPEELEEPAATRLLPTKLNGALRLEDLTFRYRGKSEPVLENVTIDVPAGATVALCGPSGAGKSTVLSLLLRFYDPQTGRVTFDGVDLRELGREDVRRHVALVQQETFLFAETIADNIRYGRPDASDADVRQAAAAANVAHFIDSLPNGYATRVGERGVLLSGGQKQRISLARAFLADPEVLLLDEPTSSVEPASERMILASIMDLLRGRTCVLTSHRPSLVESADLVYVLEHGRVSAAGPVEVVRQQSPWLASFLAGEEVEV